MKPSLLKMLPAFVFLAARGVSFAAPVSPGQAERAVGGWLRRPPAFGCRLGRTTASVRTCRTRDGTPFHVVRLAEGGFAVASGDTELEPVVAFSSGGDFVEDERNPLWELLRRDLAARRRARRRSASAEKWTALLESGATGSKTVESRGKTSIADVRVPPLLKTRWGQENDANTASGRPCYNYYTPNNYPCGCVATAGAQVMKYHGYPTNRVSAGSYPCQVMTDREWIDDWSYYPVFEDVTLRMKGGVYDWASMPAVPKDGTTAARRKAIGRLTYDVGVACRMEYAEGASSTGCYMLVPALTRRFGYANAVAACVDTSIEIALLRRAIVSNLDARLPLVAGVRGDYGHAVVLDGYGYSAGTFFVHVNMGWAGMDDAWYAPPEFGDYDALNALVYNVYPTGDAKRTIVSGRVLNPLGRPVVSAKVSAVGSDGVKYSATSGEHGVYALRLPPGGYSVSAKQDGRKSPSSSVDVAACVGNRISGNSYYVEPEPVIANACGIDLALSGEPGPEYYTVRFNRCGGSGTMLRQKIEIGRTTALAKNAFEKSGYLLDGWAVKKGGKAVHANRARVLDLATEDGASVTLYAVWRKPKLTLRRTTGGTIAKDGRAVASGKTCSVKASTKVTLTAKRKSGYRFLGWYRGSTRVSTSKTYAFRMPKKDLSLKARFKKEAGR